MAVFVEEAERISFRALVLASVAFLAASNPAWRRAAVRDDAALASEGAVAESGTSSNDGAGGVSFVAVELVNGADGQGACAVVAGCFGGAFEGVDAAEGVGVDADAVAGAKERFSLISPYSFHSSTCSRS